MFCVVAVGDDTLYGGAGADTFLIDTSVSSDGSDTMYGGEGIDLADFSGSGSVSIDLDSGRGGFRVVGDSVFRD